MSNQVIGGGNYYINNVYNEAGNRCAGGVAHEWLALPRPTR